jgi:protein XRP2
MEGGKVVQQTITKPKLDRKNFMFVGLSGQELMKKPGEINGQAFKMENLTGCTVWLMDHFAQVRYLNKR